MNRNFSGAVLLLVLAAGALSAGSMVGLFFVAATAAIAFASNEFHDDGLYMPRVRFCLALASWVTTAAAFGCAFL